MRALRGRRIAMVFQEPMSALNPVFTVGEQIVERAARHISACSKAAGARRACVELLALVGIPSPRARLDSYRTSSPAACASAS